ncbi:MAG: efflux RND transporter periplasmic adaptor subunit [Myxococcales bacterium]
MKRLTLILVAIGACACTGKPPAAESAAVRAVRVDVARLDESALGGAYAGSLEPRFRVDVAFGVAGRVRELGTIADGGTKRPLRQGDRVSKGTLLARLDDADLARSAAASSLTSAAAASEVAGAEIALAQARVDLERAHKLNAAGAIPQADLDRVGTGVKGAAAKLEIAKALRSARAEQSAIAARAQADAKLLAPADGVIARRMVEAGEMVLPQTVVFSLIDTSELELHIAVPDTRVSALHAGDAIPIRAEALPGASLAGRVATIHPVADPVLRTFTVEISVSNLDGMLRAGMVASAILGSDPKQRLLLVPLPSIVRVPDGGLGVFQLGSEGRVTLRKIAIGDLVGPDVVVKQGLEPGDRVVTDGAPFLHDGEQVQVRP